ncbi:hypothetical protein [Methylobacterium sp. GC_Met_2]|uniref:hypothetical protein n=1 Tax=Methylobacterium sp. GC_Met_2 TaxID=2937376 RepID=UPI00226BB7B8|nr:hypothetical protein [Methylobacterium sp. GC_Met_2]
MNEHFKSGSAILDLIAAALDVPVERFFVSGSSAKTAAATDECLRLWDKITTDQGRLKALEALRLIVELEQR